MYIEIFSKENHFFFFFTLIQDLIIIKRLCMGRQAEVNVTKYRPSLICNLMHILMSCILDSLSKPFIMVLIFTPPLILLSFSFLFFIQGKMSKSAFKLKPFCFSFAYFWLFNYIFSPPVGEAVLPAVPWLTFAQLGDHKALALDTAEMLH